MRTLRAYLAPASAIAGVAIIAACGSRTNLICDGEIPVIREVPNLYFVLDRSRSMRENGKWTSVKDGVSGLVTKLGGRARFGAAMFPDPNADVCDAGAEVMSVRSGDGATAATLLAAIDLLPDGGTPTAATLQALRPRLAALDGHTFVILATDGGPNCNAALTCGVDRCTANIDHISARCQPNGALNCCDPALAGPEDCLDDGRTVTAVAALRAAGIPTFVIGVPGSEAYSRVLDGAAKAGGTARSQPPFYYRVDSADAAALAAALAEVVLAATGSCFLKLGAPANADSVEVVLDGTPLARDAADGFTVEAASGGAQTITLHGAACDASRSGAAIRAHALDECPHG